MGKVLSINSPARARFPARLPPERVRARLARALEEIRPFHDKFAFAVTPPGADTVGVISDFLCRNPNTIGVHDTTTKRGTRQLEVEVIGAASRLMEGSEEDGWLTSGGTEGNMTGLWMGREYLRSQGSRNPLLVTTELRHESVDRAASILDLKDLLYLDLDSAARVSLEGIATKIRRTATRNANDSLLVVLTIGTTQAGTCDPVHEIYSALERIGMPVYIHVDASLGGLLVPFLNPNRPIGFSVTGVKSVTVDPHKLGGAPIGAGIFLCRRGLAKHTEISSRISPVLNPTLSGSRSGAVAAGVWYSLFSKGRQGLTRTARRCVAMKEYFLSNLYRAGIEVCVITDPDTNVVAINLRRRLPDHIELRYRLRPWRLGTLKDAHLRDRLFYTLKFMPHATRKAVRRLSQEIIDPEA